MTSGIDSRTPPHPDPLPEGEGTRSPEPSRLRPILAALLLFVGVELWFVIMHGLGIRPGQPTMIAVAALLGMFPPVARQITRFLDWFSNPSLRMRSLVAIAIFVLAILFLYWQAT